MSDPVVTKPPACGPVGVFDSGVGGLSVLREIRAELPAERLIYLADSGYAPYGGRPEAYIRERALACAEFLLERGAKAIVVACNTATAAAVELLRTRYTVPIVAMEPGIKPAAAATRSGRIGVLATETTAGSYRLLMLIDRYARGQRVHIQPCPGLVELIEAGHTDSAPLQALLRRYTGPLLAVGVDTLILGCTHYPLVAKAVAAAAGPAVQIIDTGRAVARQLRRVLESEGLLSAADGLGEVRLWTSGDPLRVAQVVARHWADDLPVRPWVAPRCSGLQA